MNIESLFDLHEEVKDDLKFHGISHIRMKIMILLSEGPKRTTDLRKSTRISSSTILHGISELEKQGLVFKDGDYYHISQTGKIVFSKLVDLIKTLAVVKKLEKLLLNHEIKSIPPILLKNIGDLSNSRLIKQDNTDVLNTLRIHNQNVLDSKEVRGVSPIFYPGYVETFKRILSDDVKVELILTEPILATTVGSLDSEDLKIFGRVMSEETLKIWKLNEKVEVAFTVTDKFMTLGLFSTKGMYDPTQSLISDHEDAIAWGNRLFDYYLKRAQKVNLEDFEAVIKK